MTRNCWTDEQVAACEATPATVCAEKCDDWCHAALMIDNANRFGDDEDSAENEAPIMIDPEPLIVPPGSTVVLRVSEDTPMWEARELAIQWHVAIQTYSTVVVITINSAGVPRIVTKVGS